MMSVTERTPGVSKTPGVLTEAPTPGVLTDGQSSGALAGRGVAAPARARRWPAVLAWTALVALLTLVGAQLMRRQQGPVGVDTVAPDFSLTTFQGETLNLADLRGQVVLVNFWASWCIPCEEEADFLEQAHRTLVDEGVVFIGVDYVDTEPEALAFIERFDITYANGPDVGTRISQAYRIRGVPESYVLRPDGTIDSVQIGPYPSQAAILQAVEAARRP
jgi:cytochrome c biogenesis protein CcmG/thiol:disulfide interchange protein DsbE